MLRIAVRMHRALPKGTLAVGAGLIVLGASAYVFLALAGRALDGVSYSALSVLWVVVFTIGPGVFLPLEQELARVVAHRDAVGAPVRPFLLRAAASAGAFLTVLVIVGIAAAGWLERELFRGETSLVVDLVLCLAALCAAHCTRGVLAGYGLFVRYGVQLALDGVLRAAGALLLLLGNVQAPGAYGAMLAVAPIVSVLATLPRHVPHSTKPDEGTWTEMSSKLGTLLGSSLASLVLVNTGVVAAQLLASPEQGAVAGALLSGLVLARLPYFLYASLQASLLPQLSKSVAVGNKRDFMCQVSRAVIAVCVVGLVSMVGCGAAGPFAMRVLFASEHPLGASDFVWLSTGTTLFLIAMVLGQALVALDQHRDQLFGWLAGLVALGIALASIDSLLVRIEVSFVVGAFTGLVAMASLLARRLYVRNFATARPESLVSI